MAEIACSNARDSRFPNTICANSEGYSCKIVIGLH